MYCVNCGKKLEEGNNFCKHCGNDTNNIVTKDNVSNNGTDMRAISIVLGILGIVGACMFIFSPIALVLSFIGLIIGIKANKQIKNTVGIVLNAIGLLISGICISLIGLVIRVSVNLIGRLVDNYKPTYDYKETIEEYGSNFFDNIFDNFNIWGENNNYSDSDF